MTPIPRARDSDREANAARERQGRARVLAATALQANPTPARRAYAAIGRAMKKRAGDQKGYTLPALVQIGIAAMLALSAGAIVIAVSTSSARDLSETALAIRPEPPPADHGPPEPNRPQQAQSPPPEPPAPTALQQSPPPEPPAPTALHQTPPTTTDPPPPCGIPNLNSYWDHRDARNGAKICTLRSYSADRVHARCAKDGQTESAMRKFQTESPIATTAARSNAIDDCLAKLTPEPPEPPEPPVPARMNIEDLHKCRNCPSEYPFISFRYESFAPRSEIMIHCWYPNRRNYKALNGGINTRIRNINAGSLLRATTLQELIDAAAAAGIC